MIEFVLCGAAFVAMFLVFPFVSDAVDRYWDWVEDLRDRRRK